MAGDNHAMEVDQAGPSSSQPKSEAAEPKPDPNDALEEQLQRNVRMLEQAVMLKELRLISGRLMRQTAASRKALTPGVLSKFVSKTLPSGTATRDLLLQQLQKADDAMDTDATPAEASVGQAADPAGLLPEVEVYVLLLVIMHLVDKRRYQEAREVVQAGLQRVAAQNRRTLDALAARLYFYYGWTVERTGELASIRPHLLALHRTAVLRHDEFGQETLLNLLLRSYLHYQQYEQAEQLRSKAQRPEQSRQHTQLCRYLFYLGRIRAIALDYTEAKDCLTQAARKAPTCALGFRVAATKWLVLVRLLLGEIPEYLDYLQPGLEQPLAPYRELTQAVQAGDLSQFRQVAERHAKLFAADRTHNLIVRLRHNVIRTGLKRISVAYSRISLADVAAKLGLASVEDTESIVAKTIRDGGIDAVVDHAAGNMSSREVVDVYSTDEPQAALHARVAFCLDIHNEAVKAMRFEPGAHRKKLEKLQKEKTMNDEELIKAIEEEEAEGL